MKLLDDLELHKRALKEVTIDLNMMMSTIRLLRELVYLIKSFNINYDKQTYPIDRILGIDISYIEQQKIRYKENSPVAKQQVIALEYMLNELGIESMQDADKTKVVQFIQFITGNEFGKAPKDTSIYKYLWTDHSNNRNYNRYIDEITQLFNDIGQIDLAKKLQNSKI